MEKYKDAVWLHTAYLVERRSRAAIAAECGVGRTTINRYIDRYGLNRCDHEEKRPKFVSLVCPTCGEEFTLERFAYDGKKSRGLKATYCSRSCYGKQHSIDMSGENAPNYGGKISKTISPERRKEIAARMWQTMIRTGVDKRLHEGKLRYLATCSGRETSIERAIREVLERSSIRFEAQKPLHHWVVDFLLPESNVVIEVQGDYWHGNPAKYAESDLNAMQRKNRARDRGKRAYLEKCGYTVIELWESDIKTSLAGCVYRIRREINDHVRHSERQSTRQEAI